LPGDFAFLYYGIQLLLWGSVVEIQRAIAMTKNLRERELLANRLKQLENAP
jgi:hypothetical protein